MLRGGCRGSATYANKPAVTTARRSKNNHKVFVPAGVECISCLWIVSYLALGVDE